jgi:hypothetical protein
VPTLYTYLTRWLIRRDTLTALLLLAAGLSSIGMTASATHVAPLIFGAAGLALLVRREWRGLAVVAAAAAIPLAVGLVAVRKYPLPETLEGGTHATRWFVEAIFGAGILAALALLALWLLPWLVRAGPPAALATAIAVVAGVLVAPRVLPLLADLTGVTANLRRTLWMVPLPAVVGLLAAVPAGALLERFTGAGPPLRRAAVVVPALLVAVVLVAAGNPLWQSKSGASYRVSRPVWKAHPQALADAHTILARYSGPGPVLADQRTMGAMALVTVEPRAVNARKWYARLLPEPGTARVRDRLLLTRFVEGDEPVPTRREVSRALDRLDVDLVCVRGPDERVVSEVQASGPYAETFRVGGLVCLERR